MAHVKVRDTFGEVGGQRGGRGRAASQQAAVVRNQATEERAVAAQNRLGGHGIYLRDPQTQPGDHRQGGLCACGLREGGLRGWRIR